MTRLPGQTTSATERLLDTEVLRSFVAIAESGSFTRAAADMTRRPPQAWGIKTMFRRGLWEHIGVHRPKRPTVARFADLHWVNGSGQPMPERYMTGAWRSGPDSLGYDLVQLNHYPLGAMESYVLKADRGRAVHSDHMLDVDYWVERNFCTDEDRSILSFESSDELAALKSDPELAALHDAAVAWRKARFQELMLHEPYRALFGRLLMTPPSRPVPVNAARFMIQHANRARTGEDS